MPSAEAVEAYPTPLYSGDGSIYLAEREAFDRGRASRDIEHELLLEDRNYWKSQAGKMMQSKTVTREALVEIIAADWEFTRPKHYDLADAILASGIFREEKDVKAEALEELANDSHIATWELYIRARAAEIMEG